MKVLVISGSRADSGLLRPVVNAMKDDPFFDVMDFEIWGREFTEAAKILTPEGPIPDLAMVLGDRFEILAAVINCYLLRIPIAHIAGGDITEGSYDDAMRDCISRMASVHFVTSTSAMARLTHMGCKNVHLVGSPGIDVIRKGEWKDARPIAEPYVVVSYQAETIDGTNEIDEVLCTLPTDKKCIFMLPNPDRGNDSIRKSILAYAEQESDCAIHEYLPHADFLNLIYHCDEFIGNSSSMLYEAPEMGVKTRMIGKRQKGRTIPMGDGNSSQRIVKILKYTSL